MLTQKERAASCVRASALAAAWRSHRHRVSKFSLKAQVLVFFENCWNSDCKTWWGKGRWISVILASVEIINCPVGYLRNRIKLRPGWYESKQNWGGHLDVYPFRQTVLLSLASTFSILPAVLFQNCISNRLLPWFQFRPKRQKWTILKWSDATTSWLHLL